MGKVLKKYWISMKKCGIRGSDNLEKNLVEKLVWKLVWKIGWRNKVEKLCRTFSG